MTAAPAIRLVNYMGDRDDYEEVNLIGPYPDEEAQMADLTRILNMPLGAAEMHGGVEFLPDTMAEATPSARVEAPEKLAKATTWEGVFNAFFGYDD